MVTLLWLMLPSGHFFEDGAAAILCARVGGRFDACGKRYNRGSIV